MIRSMGLTTSYNGWLVVTKWPELVGEQIAQHAKAVRFDNGTLIVAVKDAAWRQNLAMELDGIMKTIKSSSCGRVIKEIRLVGSERG